jgi:hypothetical protein
MRIVGKGKVTVRGMVKARHVIIGIIFRICSKALAAQADLSRVRFQRRP